MASIVAATYQTKFFTLHAIAIPGVDTKYHPGALIENYGAPLAEYFEGSLIVIEGNNLNIDGVDLGQGFRLFNCPHREKVGRWIRSMIDQGAMWPVSVTS